MNNGLIYIAMSLFNETVQLRLLSFFIQAPENEFYVNELAKSIRASPGSVSAVCKKLANNLLLNRNKKGNAIFYSLNNG